MRWSTIRVCGAFWLAACGATPERVSDAGPGDDAPPGPGATRDSGIDEETRMRPPAPDCGDGTLTENEACDDGNNRDGDGCLGNCLSVEPGYSCSPPGRACLPIARCGDGIVASSELCDDRNRTDGDGCSARCKLEVGFKCAGEPSVCTATRCGDSKAEGAEACDDGNALPFDGCSARCQAEPDCGEGACTSTCGDGLVLNEGCDDGNTKDGDGCSARCQPEAGFTCTTDASCEQRDGQCVLRVDAVYRDFNADHPDFEVGCGTLVPGVVATTLSGDGKPVLAQGANACVESASTFSEWYTSGARNETIVGELVLYENGTGGYVNRYGPNGEPWSGPQTFTNVVYGGPGGTGCPQCNGQCFDPCIPWGAGNTQACCAEASQPVRDGNPLFFPIDGHPDAKEDTRLQAKLPEEEYGYTGWPLEETVLPNAPLHNFHFTTEVVYWLRYEDTTNATLEFTGDDDVWVFVNGRLAVDLGGPHVPTSGRFTLDAASARTFGLTAGNVYAIHVFHAERKASGSSFKLTLTGFNTARSECTPVCGDGIVTLGEECDDGTNDGGYGECEPGCVLGAFCGDGILQSGEDCDDGARNQETGCGSCRNILLL